MFLIAGISLQFSPENLCKPQYAWSLGLVMVHQSRLANRHHDFNKSPHPPKALISSCHQSYPSSCVVWTVCLWQNALELNRNPSSSPIGWRYLNDPSSVGWRHLNDPSPLPQLIFDSRSGSSSSSLRRGYSQSGASIFGWFQISVLEMSLEKEAFHQWLPCAFKN